jgi:hypothetical protein
MPADPFLYRITYASGKVKHGHRRVLGPVIGAWKKRWGYDHAVKIERAPEPVWEDVTDQHLVRD